MYAMLYIMVFFLYSYMYVMACFRYCPGCRNDASEVVLAGEKLKESKKKSKMASASSSSQRDWGKVSYIFTVYASWPWYVFFYKLN